MGKYKVLVIGGYGSFGKWVVQALAEDPLINVVVAGRNGEKANKMAETVNSQLGNTNTEGMALDASDPYLYRYVKNLDINVVIHTSGPFQNQTYQVAEACIEAGCHYIDLSDSREFVTGITKLNRKAVESNLAVISGASTVPGLSSAVINHFKNDFDKLESIEYSIVPGNKAPKGLATISAILSYTGHPFQRWENTAWKTAYGWQDLQLHNYGSKLGKKWVCSCDIPDLELFPALYKDLNTIKFYAGLELSLLHFSMWSMSWLTRAKIIKNWLPYANVITNMSSFFDRFGSDTGGMLIKLSGKKQSEELHKNWRLLATGGHGPRIPTISAIIVTKKLANNTLNKYGAFPCIGLFTLEEFNKEIKTLHITQDIY